jgi:hypothetical protein
VLVVCGGRGGGAWCVVVVVVETYVILPGMPRDT